MTNPWIEIPAADYIGHMSSPEVGQYQLLNEIFRRVLTTVSPLTLLVLGCGTGNGFEHVDPVVTARVVGVDINPDYLQRLTSRFAPTEYDLELQCADLATFRFERDAFDLVHAALVFEYLDWRAVLPRIVQTLAQDGVLSVVVQLPSAVMPTVTPSEYTSLLALESIFQFVDPDALVAEATAAGLHIEHRTTERLPSGKGFEALRFRNGIIKS